MFRNSAHPRDPRARSGILEGSKIHEGATVMLIHGVGAPGVTFRHDSGQSRRNYQADPWRRNAESNVLACFRIFERLSSKEAVPFVE
eukprot:1698485-Pyramimonas_sp.AAC.1